MLQVIAEQSQRDMNVVFAKAQSFLGEHATKTTND